MKGKSASLSLSRRGVLAGAGALIVSFRMSSPGSAEDAKPALPGALADTPSLDAWIRIDGQSEITVFTGKAELGQGVRTALIQIAAEELNVDPGEIHLITADTARTPNEGYTAGSQSMQMSGTAIRNAAAEVRARLTAEAAKQWSLTPRALATGDKKVRRPDGRTLGYGELAAALDLHVDAQPGATLTRPENFKVMGKPLQRVDIPAKVTGGAAYVQDLKLPDMLHARMVRPPSYSAQLIDLDVAAIRKMPGVVQVIRDGNFIAVVAKGEFQAVEAMRTMAAAARWQERPELPAGAKTAELLKSLERQVGTVAQSGTPIGDVAGASFRARYSRAYQMHGSIGPSCAVAVAKEGGLTVWSHTQGVYPDRKAIAEMLGMPIEQVRVIHTEGSGCYGHNGADDAAADAALIASHMPGTPIRLQWMREQEHTNEPYGPAMLTEVTANLTADGRIEAWNYDLWSNTHSTRPGGAGTLLAARTMAKAFPPEPAEMEITPSGNGDRNADPLYTIPNRRVLWHFLPDMPIRVSALRSLGAYMNVFSLESTMDELARKTGADPVAFRLRHLDDARGKAVIRKAAEEFGWDRYARTPGKGRGFAFARYKNHAAYLAIALEAEISRDTGRVHVIRVVAAIDSGEIVNPDGIRNQTEGGILQSMSWTLFEQVTFDRTRITSRDWASYPILRFNSVPESIDVHIMDRPGMPFLGTGEAAQGPTSAAIANAIRDAIGVRLYDLPLTRDRVRAAASI